MPTVGGKRALATAKVQFTRDLTALYRQASGQIADILRTYAGAGETIPRRQQNRVLSESDVIMQRLFTANDGRTVFDANDPTRAASPFANILNKALIIAIRPIVEAHAAYMRRVMPEDLQRDLMILTRAQFVSEQGPGDQGHLPGLGYGVGSVPTSRLSAERRAFLERFRNLRLFSPDPLAQYDSAHTWVDPNGYELSDRIWRAGQRTRARIDALLGEGIRQGRSASAIARDLEQFLLPTRASFRTRRPYGVDASFDAMRLGRSEITRAHSAAALAAARMNPYVDSMIYALSPSHPQFDICDGYATIGGGGSREPYPINGFVPSPVQDTHPQCLCVLIPAVTASPAQVTAELRDAVQQARELYISPHLTPLQADEFLALLIGRHLAGELVG